MNACEPKEIAVCRCEDIDLSQIRAAIANGYTDFDELKRFLRVGMGPCQGRTCIPIIRRELARFLGVDVSQIRIPTQRPPAANVLFGTIEKCHE